MADGGCSWPPARNGLFPALRLVQRRLVRFVGLFQFVGFVRHLGVASKDRARRQSRLKGPTSYLRRVTRAKRLGLRDVPSRPFQPSLFPQKRGKTRWKR